MVLQGGQVWRQPQNICVTLVTLSKRMPAARVAEVEDTAHGENVHGSRLAHYTAVPRYQLLWRLPATASA